MTRGTLSLSRATTPTLPAFLNLNGSISVDIQPEHENRALGRPTRIPTPESNYSLDVPIVFETLV